MSGEEFRKCRTIGATIKCVDPVTNVSENVKVGKYTYEDVIREIKVLSRALP